ncbi:MAG: methyl-accepting chemotaxis protein [Spirochaetales bacterium]|nr:methyl-accepting chemotaxis protein [Spirochaetales bacterium]
MNLAQLTKTIAFKLVISTMIVLTLLMSFLTFTELGIIRRGVSEIENTNMERMASSITETLELSFESKRKLLETFSTGSGVGSKLFFYLYGNPRKTRSVRASLIQDMEILHMADKDLENVFITDRSGLVVSSNATNSLLNKHLDGYDFYKVVIENKQSSFISPTIIKSPSSGNDVLVIAQALYFNNIMVGLMGATLNLDKLAENYILDKKVGHTGYAFVFNGSGKILVHPDKELFMADWSSTDFISRSIGGEEKVSDQFKYKGETKQVSVNRLNNPDWYIALSMDESELLELSDRLSLLLIGFYVFLMLLMTLFLVLFSHRFIARPLRSVLEIVHEASEGDLSSRGTISGQDELGEMTHSFNHMLESLNNFFHQLQNQMGVMEDGGMDLVANMEETSAAVHQINANITSNKRHIEMQKNSVDATVASVEEIARNIENQDNQIGRQGTQILNSSSAVEQMVAQMTSLSESTDKASDYMKELNQSSQTGETNMNEVAQMLRDIEGKSQELEAANTMISSIAAQTNLLAMNAAIEAAHAGEAGRGFAVVADEIRKLAEQSTSQSKQINSSISEIKNNIHDVVTSSETTTHSFLTIMENVRLVDDITKEIKIAMNEQVEGSSQVLSSLKEMRGISLEVDRGSKEMTQGNKSILNSVTALLDVTRVVGEAMAEIEQGVNEISKSVQTISSLSEQNKESISLVRNEADKYKLLED